MRVFNTCMLIMKRHRAILLTYLALFLPLSAMLSASSASNFNMSFDEAQPKYTIINRDENTAITEGLSTFLNKKGINVELEDDREAIQDASFFHKTAYILFIPEGFTYSLFTDDMQNIEVFSTPNSIDSYYMDMLVQQYFDIARMYKLALPDIDDEQLVANVLNDLDVTASVDKINFNESTPINGSYQGFNRVLPYVLLVAIILCSSTVLMAFNRSEIQMRNRCSAIKPVSITFQLILYIGLISIIVWTVLNIFGIAINYNNLIEADKRLIGLILLNNFVYTIFSMSAALLLCSFIKDSNTQNSVSNITALVLCFLGGVFVPLEMFGDTLLKVAKFIPTYWYSSALQSICETQELNGTILKPIFTDMLVQLGFTFAIICICLVINKKPQTSNSLGSSRTQLD